MSRLLKTQQTYFRLFVSKTSDIQRRRLLDTITNDQLKALVQIVKNFLQKTFSVPSSSLATLTRRKRLLRNLADTSLTLKDKKTLLRHKEKAITEFLRAVQSSLEAYLR